MIVYVEVAKFREIFRRRLQEYWTQEICDSCQLILDDSLVEVCPGMCINCYHDDSQHHEGRCLIIDNDNKEGKFEDCPCRGYKKVGD